MKIKSVKISGKRPLNHDTVEQLATEYNLFFDSCAGVVFALKKKEGQHWLQPFPPNSESGDGHSLLKYLDDTQHGLYPVEEILLEEGGFGEHFEIYLNDEPIGVSASRAAVSTPRLSPPLPPQKPQIQYSIDDISEQMPDKSKFLK